MKVFCELYCKAGESISTHSLIVSTCVEGNKCEIKLIPGFVGDPPWNPFKKEAWNSRRPSLGSAVLGYNGAIF